MTPENRRIRRKKTELEIWKKKELRRQEKWQKGRRRKRKKKTESKS